MNNAEACRTMGRHPRQGLRWKHEQGGQVPPGTFRSGRYLDIDERCLIADLRRVGVSRRQIAARLGRDVSTISRELRRNASPRTGEYGPHLAQRLADARLPRPRSGKIAGNAVLRARIEEALARRWSPEQISRWLRQTFVDRPELQVCHETIYQALYVEGRGTLRRDLRTCLRTGRAIRKRQGDHRHPRFADPPIMIRSPSQWPGTARSPATGKGT